MPANNSDEVATEDRRVKAWELRVRGKTYREIGAALGVSHVTAWEDVKFIGERSRAETNDSVEHHRAVELSRLDRQAAVLMPMVDAADPDTLRQALESGKDPKLVLVQATHALEAIDRLDKLAKRRAALLGLDAPTKVSAEVASVGLDDIRALRKSAEDNECSSSDQQR
jgi:hypothetical protein